MSTENRKKRLVGWTKYAETAGEKGITYSFSGAFGCGGVLLLLVAVGYIMESLFKLDIGHIQDGIWGLVTGSIVGGFGLLGTWAARYLFREAREIAPVALLTKSSAKHLPEVETLVRGSARPTTAERAELLRAAQYGKKTPPEELLRASREIKQD